MWMVDNRTAFAAGRNWWLDKDAAKHWVVAVRGAFDILPDGRTLPAKKQDEPLLAPVHAGEPGKSSLLYEADLAGPKKATDVLVNGRAHAPGGKPATQVPVRLKVHTIDKSLQVTGDRRWERGLVGPTLSPPQPFTTLPIVYERTFGGYDQRPENPKDHRLEARNPIGVGFVVRREHLLDQRAPNVELPGKSGPAGFGAICSYWQPRLQYAGTYDDAWLKNRMPLFPTDFDERYYQCAPEDQQVTGFLRGGETVELTNLSASGALSFVLPKVYFTFTTWFGRRSVEHRADLHTVVIEPDHPRVILIWYTKLGVSPQQVDYLDKTVIREKPFEEK